MLEKLGVSYNTGLLSNNIRLDLYSKKNAPIEIRFNILGGDIYNSDLNKKGLAHFMEHIFCAGTQELVSKDKVGLYLDSFGGYLGGETWCDKLILKMGCPDSSDFEKLIKVLSSALRNPLLEKNIIESERGSIISEFNIKMSNNNNKVYREYIDCMFEGTVYQNEVLGSIETISNIQLVDFKEWIEVNLVGGKIGICITGDLEFSNVVLLLEKYFEFIGKSNNFRVDLPILNSGVIDSYPEEGKNLRYVETNEKNCFLLIGFKSVGFYGNDYLILNFLNSILGQRRSNLLTKKLRYESGLSYSPKSTFLRFFDMGHLTIEINCKLEDVNKVIEIVNKIITEDFEKELTEERFLLEKNRFNKIIPSNFEKNSEFINFGNFDTLSTYKTDFNKVIDDVNSLEYQDFLRVGKTFLRNKNWYISYSGKEMIELKKIEK